MLYTYVCKHKHIWFEWHQPAILDSKFNIINYFYFAHLTAALT